MWNQRPDGPDRTRDVGADRRERRGVMAALDASHPLIWFDAGGWIVDASRRASDLLLYDFAEQDPLHYSALTGMREGRVDRSGAHWARIASGQLVAEERSVYRADATEIWSSMTYAAILNADESTRRVLAIVIDLSPWSWRPKADAPLRLE